MSLDRAMTFEASSHLDVDDVALAARVIRSVR
jgi:hypothetical protein